MKILMTVLMKDEDFINKPAKRWDFECNPTGDCWCKEVEYTSQIKLPIPLLNENKVCYSPDELKKLINLSNS